MAIFDHKPNSDEKKITIIKNGPYLVHGKVPLVHKIQVVSEFGEPLTWKKDRVITTDEEDYALCRCGRSSCKPFCDGTHRKVGFDGTECASERLTANRRIEIRGGPRLIVRKDPTLCMNSGFCGMRKKSLSQFVASTGDTQIRSLVIAMVERCPSGALTYSLEPGEPDIEPDLPQQIAATTEIISEGPIQGPLWVTGEIRVERSDGLTLETRNRVTLCNCGHSANRPLCDGTHRHEAEHH